MSVRLLSRYVLTLLCAAALLSGCVSMTMEEGQEAATFEAMTATSQVTVAVTPQPTSGTPYPEVVGAGNTPAPSDPTTNQESTVMPTQPGEANPTQLAAMSNAGTMTPEGIPPVTAAAGQEIITSTGTLTGTQAASLPGTGATPTPGAGVPGAAGPTVAPQATAEGATAPLATAVQGEAAGEPTVSFTLTTGAGPEGQLAFIGQGGEIDGMANPTLNVQPGDVVEILVVNGDGLRSDFAIPALGVQSDAIQGQGEEVRIVFRVDQAGTYEYISTIPGHQQAGQVGQLVVGGGSAQNSPAATGQATVETGTPTPVGTPTPET